MNSTKLSFESENLVVDYFELKFDVLSEHTKQKIVQSFFKLGFNSFDVDKKYRDFIQTRIQTNSKNQHQIQFVVNVSSYWNGYTRSSPNLYKFTYPKFYLLIQVLCQNMKSQKLL